MITFNAADLARVMAGEITVSWRLWKHAHVTAGKTYAFAGGGLEILDLRKVAVSDVTDADAHEVGLPDAFSLLELARSHTGAVLAPETLLYRVEFRWLDEPPAKPQLPLEEIARKLRRLDESRGFPWTEAMLRQIEANPGVLARVLAAEAGRGKVDYKTDARKLKALGLVLSAEESGYELSELGLRYLDNLNDD